MDGHAPRACKKRTKLKLRPGAHTVAVWVVAHHHKSKKRHVPVIVPSPAPPGVSVGDQPVAIAAAGTNLWISTAGDAVRVDTATKTVTKRIAVGGQLGGIAATDSDVWVSVYDGGEVAHIDVAKGKVVGRTTVGGQPSAVAFFAGSVWVGNLDGHAARIDPATGHVQATVSLPSGVSAFLPIGNLLYAGLQSGALVAIDPATNAMSGKAVDVAPDLDALVNTPDGIWGSTFSGVAANIDPVKGLVVKRVSLPSRGAGIAYGGGKVWFSAYDSRLAIAISPFNAMPIGAVHTGGGPRDSVVVGNTLWVVDQNSGKLTPIPVG